MDDSDHQKNGWDLLNNFEFIFPSKFIVKMASFGAGNLSALPQESG
jgi:hypothetical protein